MVNETRRTSYMKLNVDEMSVDNTREKVIIVWNVKMLGDRDPRINWELGWKAVKKALKEIQKARDEAEKECARLEDQLFNLRMNIGITPDEEQIRTLSELAGEVQRRERHLPFYGGQGVNLNGPN